MAQDTQRPERRIGGELVIPIISVVFVLYFFSTIWNSPWTAQVSAFLVGGLLLLMCAIFFVRAALMLRNGQATLSFDNIVNRDDLRTGRVGLIAATIGYCVLIDYGGFTLTTFLFLAISMAILGHGRRLGLIVVISALMSLGGWAVFIFAFDTRFPRGIFETFMTSVIANG